jgi:hypothetical protein
MSVPSLRGVTARLRHGVGQAPAVLRGFSGARLHRHISRGTFRDREILAARPTGFGSRMGELLNAHRVASGLGAPFVFHWPVAPSFDVDKVEAVFAPRFVAAHHLPTLATNEFGHLTTTITPSDLSGLAVGAGRGARMAERYELTLKVRGLTLPSFREAFIEVLFHPDLERIRTMVDALPAIGLTVHVRRPDLALPASRFGGTYSSKQIPMVLIEKIIEVIPRGTSEHVLLIGNDQRVADDIAQRTGAATPEALAGLGSNSPQERAFRDFCLLSRSRAVLGGTSAFARVPQLIAGSRVIRPEEVLSREETRALLWLAVMRNDPQHPLEATLASDHLFQREDLNLSATDELELLERTVELDPDDPTRWLGLLVRKARLGETSGARRTMVAMAARFEGSEEVALARAAQGRTGMASPGHLTHADWCDLVKLGVLDATWSDALRSITEGAGTTDP